MSKNQAAIFTGQGSQRPGMGKDFYDAYETARNVFNIASEAAGEDMAALCFQEDPRLNLTEYTQPAIVTTEIAIYTSIVEKYGFAPKFFAGHSLGEYAALVAAGVIPLADAIKIVRKRGRLMQKAVPEGVGKMAALLSDTLEQTEYANIVLENGAEIANYNSAAQVVISGTTASIDKTIAALAAKYPEMRVVPLEVSAPFHSSLMRVIEPEFQTFLEQFAPGFNLDAASRVYSNFTGNLHTKDTLIQNLVKQISGSVRWTENMKALAATGADIFEIGPNKVLSKFFSTIQITVPSIINERSAQKTFEG